MITKPLKKIADVIPIKYLEILQESFQNFLHTSTAIYELDGSFAPNLITSNYCKLLMNACDEKSEKNKGICQKDCWYVSKKSIDINEPYIGECSGGLIIYSIPIMLDGMPIGAANVGISNPPRHNSQIKKIAEKYQIFIEDLKTSISEYEHYPEFNLKAAKRQIKIVAKIIALLYNNFYESQKARNMLVEEITKHKQTKKRLRESEEKFRTINDTARDGIIMVDNKGNISYWNKGAEMIFGYSKKETVGEKLREIIIPDRFRKVHLKEFMRFEKTAQGNIIGKTVELEAKRKDGAEFPVEISLSSVKMKGKWHSIGVIRDITERKQIEERFRASYKMASLGRLTAGVFHEILNPVNIISSHIQLMLIKAEKGSGRKGLKVNPGRDYAYC